MSYDDYLIVVTSSVAELQAKVSDVARKGYEPCGGITYIPPTSKCTGMRYLQPMFRPEPDAF